ncbi:acyl-homoserine-lactone synthase [Halothiobacillus neapolitanus]|uniref:Acyl-homoserine-lactone synthase n=1 Tax=Halothiobacillus neapolitanus (strain ATCC 23641 / DSM 15147 / CIP 104769 / NCIMB 8539 / c2) TaxID=555778 RepID=D0KZD0_HALNC|nr:acyl-homoserine-lactone synthase [Halothiobacillus neapolitanus]ACX95803.1 Acyl-homoserine-lactone synthase [Halothiobacillus neapolitanus c2]TDN66114.1 N-acyl-L-homoserine lactone synthetase [Halothiobacillus neapolitanus]
MRIEYGSKTSLPFGLFEDLSYYRNDVFVRLLGWDLDTPYGVELDQFDRPDTVYVVAKNDEGRINGCARLLPTTSPYLLGEVFPELLNGLCPPSSPDVWELSRFAAVDVSAEPTSARGQLSSPIAITLLRSSLQTAATLGAKSVITVSPIGIERLLRHAGFQAHRAGPPMVVGGHPIFACWIDIAPSLT